MKFKINLKLTGFLVSLFIGLMFLILGANNKYCIAVGFLIIGFSLPLFVFYSNKKIDLSLTQLAQEIDEVEASDEIDELDKVYILKQLYIRQKKLNKNKKTTAITFSVAAFGLIVLGFMGLF